MSYFDKKKSGEERFKFIIMWANYVRNSPDKSWSRQQKVLIDSQLKGAEKQLLSLKDYLRIKKQA